MQIIELKNKNGMVVKISPYGGIIKSIKVPVNGEMRECVLGFDKIEDYKSEKYLENYPYLGALIGRNAGRIANSEFTLNDKKITVSANQHPNHLHGGNEGFDKKNWTVKNQQTDSVTLSYLSKNGEEGYPGNLNVEVKYSLNDNNEIKVEYFTETDEPTYVNLTQHSYFNLAAGHSEDVSGHQLQIPSSKYVPLNELLLPTGAIEAVEGTIYDYRQPKAPDADLDNSFVLENHNTAGTLTSPDGAVKLEVSTTYPVLHIYTGYYLPEIEVAGRKTIKKNAGLCFEAQGFADAPNQPSFKSTLLNSGEKYQHQTIFKFNF